MAKLWLFVVIKCEVISAELLLLCCIIEYRIKKAKAGECQPLWAWNITHFPITLHLKLIFQLSLSLTQSRENDRYYYLPLKSKPYYNYAPLVSPTPLHLYSWNSVFLLGPEMVFGLMISQTQKCLRCNLPFIGLPLNIILALMGRESNHHGVPKWLGTNFKLIFHLARPKFDS